MFDQRYTDSPKRFNFFTLRWLLGLLLTWVVAQTALWISHLPTVQDLGLSSLSIAIVLGMLVANTLYPMLATYTDEGINFAKSSLLKLGIILYGFQITVQDVLAIGWRAVVIDLLMVSCVFSLAVLVGVRYFKLDKATAILIGAGSAICGAAAVMATQSVLRAQPHKVAVAVATVVVFGTLAMLVYPMLYPYLQLSEVAYGVFVGSTVHEVAQVVAAGNSVGDVATSTAIVTKMLRVMLLVPFLLILSYAILPSTPKKSLRQISVPWFAVLFLLTIGVHSMQWLSSHQVEWIYQLDAFLLTMAMAALGLHTRIATVRAAGLKPLLLAALLMLFLLIGGYVINVSVSHLATLADISSP